MKDNVLFPVFLKLHQLRVLVVGGGYVGWEKLQALLTNSPLVSVDLVGTTIRKEIKLLAAEYPNLRLHERPFDLHDLEQIEVALLATDSRETNHRIRTLAKAKNILVNVADTPDLCDFYLGSVVKKGNLKIGISTNGKSPTFAKRFRQVLEEVLPEETDMLLSNLRVLRDRLKGDFEYKVNKLNEYTASLIKENK